MSPEAIDRGTNSKSNLPDINLPLSLYASFAEIAEMPIKLCGMDGQLLPGAPNIPATGPCALLSGENEFCETCANSHAVAASMAVELRRPYIYNCHMRLASWAVPILQNDNPLPAVIVCGGILLSEPDIALLEHLKTMGTKHNLEPDALVNSLDDVPVLPRMYFRTIADFLFRMSCAFASYAALPGASEVVTPSPPNTPVVRVVVPASQRKETRKVRLERTRRLERQNAESEIVRLIRERKPKAAQELLLEILKVENAAAESMAANLNTSETLTRLFRTIGEGVRVPQTLLQKHSLIISDVLLRRTPIEETCSKFILIAEELTGEPRPRKIRVIQKYVENNLSKKMTLGIIGEKFGMKEKPLDALIRKYCGMGFTDYVTLLRISEAKRLLQTTSLTMGEIARQTGFSDQGYLTKVFKSKIGVTPTEFRQK